MAAEAFVPLVLEILRRQQAARPQLHLATEDTQPDGYTPVRRLPAIV